MFSKYFILNQKPCAQHEFQKYMHFNPTNFLFELHTVCLRV